MNDTITSILNSDFEFISSQVLSEDQLRIIAQKIIEKSNRNEQITFIKTLLSEIPNQKISREFDWNTGSIIQHFEGELVASALKKINDPRAFSESIGVNWALGELMNYDSVIVDVLYETISHGRNSEAWWKSAFSLQRLGMGEAVSLLKRSIKRSQLKSIEKLFGSIDDKRSIISLLHYCTSDKIENIIYPKLKEIFFKSKKTSTLINCAWLFARLRLLNTELRFRVIELIETTSDYELKYYLFASLQEHATLDYFTIFQEFLGDSDPLLRKMAVRGYAYLADSAHLSTLQDLLYEEKNERVIAELTKAIYVLQNPAYNKKARLMRKYAINENGLIVDESDKWYADPSIYDVFSEAEDPENICISIILRHIKKIKLTIHNPVDLASGTGRMLRQILHNFSFEGTAYAVDASETMVGYLGKIVKRNHYYVHDVKIIKETIQSLSLPSKSSFIISSFGFPSKISNQTQCYAELEAVVENLADNGIFVTIGWDESFNDELNRMWYRYIPDDIPAKSFEEWRRKRASQIQSPRNCGLQWFKKGISVPLQLPSLEESLYVMGHLFGRDALSEIIESNKTSWHMSLGITISTKRDLIQILDLWQQKK